MKTLFLSLLFTTGATYAQNTLSFEYDEAGNQKIRELTCVNCNTPSAGRHAMVNDNEENPDKVLSGKISYYPNPVLEQLHIDWTNDENSYLKKIEVYSMSGQLIVSQENPKDKNNTILEFSNMAQGIYNITFEYSDGQSKTIKVVKK